MVLGVLSVVDLAGPLATDGEHPPMEIALIGAALGLLSLILVVLAWRGKRRAVVPLIALRVLSAVTALPAFFVGDVPAIAVLLAGVLVALTALGVALVLVPARQLAGAR
ncbi:hypothetical protein GCM10009741_74240 [Kribbella lupini]|uniref:Uncharacterized protein n=1 Tax=Kribbella lupini TaxID=291602 RepID=A0ABN2CIE9_9ACTN